MMKPCLSVLFFICSFIVLQPGWKIVPVCFIALLLYCFTLCLASMKAVRLSSQSAVSTVAILPWSLAAARAGLIGS